MFYWRYEAEEIRQGFNFYPRNDGGSVGCQMLFGRLRVEARWSRRTKRFTFGMWLRTYVKPTKEELVYIPGYTDELKKLYENQNSYCDKKYEDWEHDSENTTETEKQLIPGNERHRWAFWAK